MFSQKVYKALILIVFSINQVGAFKFPSKDQALDFVKTNTSAICTEAKSKSYEFYSASTKFVGTKYQEFSELDKKEFALSSLRNSASVTKKAGSYLLSNQKVNSCLASYVLYTAKYGKENSVVPSLMVCIPIGLLNFGWNCWQTSRKTNQIKASDCQNFSN